MIGTKRWRLRGFLVTGFAAFAIFVVSAAGAPGSAGDLDPSWGGAGFVTTPFPGEYSFADGVAVRGGDVTAVGGVFATDGDFALARYNRDGSLDDSFGTGGLVTTGFTLGSDDLASAAAYQEDKLVAVGYTTPDGVTFSFALTRYLRNGTLDPSFGSGGKVVSSFSGYDFADAVVVKGDKIIVAGESRSGGGGNNFIVARYNRDGSLDSSFGTGGFVTTDFNGGFDSANGVAVMGDKIVAAGYVNYLTGNSDFGLARYTKDGALDTSFGTGGKVETDFAGGDDAGHAIDVKGDRIVVVGSAATTLNTDFAAALYDKHGALDSSFGGDGKATLDLGGVDYEAFGGGFGPHESVVAGGVSPDLAGGFAVARWTKQGVADPAFGGGDGFTTTPIGAASGGFALGLGPEDKIVLAGYSDNDFAVARYLGK